MIKYFAKLGLNSKVIETTHVGDNNAPTEKAGIEYLHKHTNYPFWVQTFKDRSQRKHYASKGYTYDEDRDAFLPPQPYPSWTLNEDTCSWEPPVANPLRTHTPLFDSGAYYIWNEKTGSWELNS